MSRAASRRSFLGVAIAACLARPPALAQPSSPKVVGYLSGGQGPEWLARALARRGYVDGRNLRIETRIPADWNAATLDKAAAELVALKPDALYALMGNRVSALARATKTIPIVCGGMPDPVEAGLAQSLRRPGGNVTGLSFGLRESAEGTIALLKTMRPGLRRVGGLFPHGLPPALMGAWWVEPCRKVGLEWMPAAIGAPGEVERALAPLAGEAVFVAPVKDPALAAASHAIATRLRILSAGMVESGAVLSYGLDFADHEGRIAEILDKVLRGMNPAEIPFELPDRPSFELNRRAARAIGLEIAPEVLLRATRLVD